jgi:chromosome segregation ATPase
MGAKKIILLIIFICSILSCDNTATNQEIVRLKQENSTLKTSLDRTKEEKANAIHRDLEQSKIIDDALLELSEISESSNKIRISLGESNTSNYLTQTEKLSNQIELIKKNLDTLKNGYPDLYNRIENLITLVETKEKEISLLRDDIEKKNIEIASKTEVIINQGATINKINEDIEQAKKDIDQLYSKNKNQMAELWFQMGENLISISCNLPEVRGVKDKKMIQETHLTIQLNAKNCYREAYNLGHPQAYSKYNRY